MAFGFSFGKIKFSDNDTIFSISYNGTVRFIINKATGNITVGAVDGTGVSTIVVDSITGATADFTGQVNITNLQPVDMEINGHVIMNGGAGTYFQFPAVTTAQRDAITEANGMVVWNTDDTKLQVCVGTNTWNNLH